MSKGPYAGPQAVLKVIHHGSNTSSTPLFLSRVQPEVAVVQVGANNSYGHPTPQTPERLQEAGTRVFRNDEHGDVVVPMQDDNVDVAVTQGKLEIERRTFRRRRASYLRSRNDSVHLP